MIVDRLDKNISFHDRWYRTQMFLNSSLETF